MSANTFTITGQSGYLIVPIVAVPAATAWAFGYYREHLPEFCLDNAGKVIGFAALFTLALLLAAAFLKSRRMQVQGDRLRYTSWFTDRVIQAHAVSAVSLDTETTADDDGFQTEHFLTLWRGKDSLLRLNLRLWPRAGLLVLLDWLQRSAPSVRFDHAVERYRARAAPA